MGKNTQNKVKITREFSSGGIVYKKENGRVFWLIRKTSASKTFSETHWMLPKGWLDDSGNGLPGPMASGIIKADNKSLESTAIREVAEETGVKAEIVNKIETIKFFYKHPERGEILKFVTFYLMKWISNLPEGFDGETSEIAWLSYEDAFKMLSFQKEKDVLETAEKMLGKNSSNKIS